jgi:hypothetical protein
MYDEAVAIFKSTPVPRPFAASVYQRMLLTVPTPVPLKNSLVAAQKE